MTEPAQPALITFLIRSPRPCFSLDGSLTLFNLLKARRLSAAEAYGQPLCGCWIDWAKSSQIVT